MNKSPPVHYWRQNLSTAGAASNESTVRVLAATLSSVGVLDASGTVSGALSVIAPVEDPVVGIGLQLTAAGGFTGVSGACTVGSTVVGVVLVVSLEDGEGLGGRSASVVRALGSLDGVGSGSS